MSINYCPECSKKIESKNTVCPYCGFDIPEYVSAFERIYNQKVKEDVFNPNKKVDPQKVERIVYQQSVEIIGPKCPTCGSKDLRKISGLSKVGSVALWGVLAAGKVSKNWHCNNCGSEW